MGSLQLRLERDFKPLKFSKTLLLKQPLTKNEAISSKKQERALKNKISHTKSERQNNRMQIEYVEQNKMVKKSGRADKRQFLQDSAE